MHRSFLTLALILCAACATQSNQKTSSVEASNEATIDTKGRLPAARSFTFTYEVEIPTVAEGTKELKLWVPNPLTIPGTQTVGAMSAVMPPGATMVANGDASGLNLIVCVTVPAPKSGSKFSFSWPVMRSEVKSGAFRGAGVTALTDAQKADFSRWLQADNLVPIDGKVADIASRLATKETNTLNIARAIYDYVLADMRYSKDGTGWGRGDTLWACDSKFGNCTDFHSLFISLARAKGIPARFTMGTSVPIKRGEGPIAGYHCWAEFYIADVGWIPVDISEADRDPAMAQYYFGNLTEDRVSYTVGRDLQFNPKPAKGVIPFFIYPLAEADGKETEAKRSFKYRDN